MMNLQKAEQFRTILKSQLKSLMGESETTMKGMTHDDEVYADMVDTASVETDKTIQLRIRDRERMLMVKIEEALSRIDAGTFGECESCGEMISEARLRARPVTTLCIDCKGEMERSEHKNVYPV